MDGLEIKKPRDISCIAGGSEKANCGSYSSVGKVLTAEARGPEFNPQHQLKNQNKTKARHGGSGG